jgi:hypothetical protein
MSRREPSRLRSREEQPSTWGPFIDQGGLVAEIDKLLIEDGWQRASGVGTIQHRGGFVTNRFVWRRRQDGLSQTHTLITRVELGRAA